MDAFIPGQILLIRLASGDDLQLEFVSEEDHWLVCTGDVMNTIGLHHNGEACIPYSAIKFIQPIDEE